MNATAQKKERTLLERYEFAQAAGAIDIDEEGGICVDPSINDSTLADDLLNELPASILASGHGYILGALGKLRSPR
jgi:hypothetical protein